MKIRIRGNSLRFRLTKPEVEDLCTKGRVEETTSFGDTIFTYRVIMSADHNSLHADFHDKTITLFVPNAQIKDWHLNEVVGFEHSMAFDTKTDLQLLIEKDFSCLTPRGEDESDNYTNPKAALK
ncbi:MAG: DUF7009 family protein [Flavobacteriaceae bacterium]